MGELIECGLGALVLRGERFEITQRDCLFLARYIKKAAEGKWNCPGGKLNALFDAGHNPLYGPDKKKQLYEKSEDTCVREFPEETNLHVKIVDHLYTTDRPGVKNNNIYRIHMYLCELVGEYNPIIELREFDKYDLFDAKTVHTVEKTDHVTEQLVPMLIEKKLLL